MTAEHSTLARVNKTDETFKSQTKYLDKICTNMPETQPTGMKINQTQELVSKSTSNKVVKKKKPKVKTIVGYRRKTRRRFGTVSQARSVTAMKVRNKSLKRLREAEALKLQI